MQDMNCNEHKTGLVPGAVKLIKELAPRVIYTEKHFINNEGKNVDVYTYRVLPGAGAHCEVHATPWGTTKTVPDQAADMRKNGRRVVGAVNAGYFHLAAGTLDPYGLQLVDGVVNNEPSDGDLEHCNSWFGVTTGGDYVISDTAGYRQIYKGKLRFGIGGGYRHVIGGKHVLAPDTGKHPLTAVAVTADGGVAIVCTDGRTERSASISCYDLVDIYADMGVALRDMMLLDGGGSTTVVIENTDLPGGVELRNVPSDGALRPVSDIIAIVAD